MEQLLVHTSGAKTRYWKATLEDRTLTTATGSKLEKLRQRKREFPDPDAAKKHFNKTSRKKMREGFVYVRDLEKAQPGEVVFQGLPPDSSVSSFLDLHPDGHTLAIGTIKGGAYSASLYFMDLRTGEHTELLSVSAEHPRQTFLHSVRFGPNGKSLYYALNGETVRLDPETGEAETVGGYDYWADGTTNLNPFCVRPDTDSSKTRLLYFDEGNFAKVYDAGEGAALFETRVGSDTAECRAGCVSRSGKLIALYVASRHLIYGHDDAASDDTNEVQIWNVDQGLLVKTLRFDQDVKRIGFSPDEKHLLATVGTRQGLAIFDLERGTEIFSFQARSPYLDGLESCHSWAFSPDGRTLAFGAHRAVWLVDYETKEITDLPNPSSQRPHRLLFSECGRLLLSGGDHGDLIAWKVADSL